VALGEFIVHLSQDAVPASDSWLENLVAPFSDPAVAISCGHSIPDPARGYPQFAWERNGYFYFTREMLKYRDAHGRGVSFANAAVRRSAWERLRIEAQALAEDFQFQMKVQNAGMRVAFAEAADVWHHHTYDLRGLWVRCRNEGLAMRQMGIDYTSGDLARDLVSPRKYVQWLREVRYGRMHTAAEALFPLVRPLAVYAGGHFARGFRRQAYGASEAA
jgi:cellulose synthase/poly-beta-1,6-N-acetylglucosamine synthase-like glycosyltransferase